MTDNLTNVYSIKTMISFKFTNINMNVFYFNHINVNYIYWKNKKSLIIKTYLPIKNWN